MWKIKYVESLRWAMGETSAKSMRGSGMEDVIFSGTSNKASKNIAEVSIDVDNKIMKVQSNTVNLMKLMLEEKLKKIKVQSFI